MALSIGTKAPEISLLHMGDEGLESVKIGGTTDKPTVLLFFPLAGSGVCTNEMCMVRDDFGGFAADGANVYGVSTDNPFAQKVWAESVAIEVVLLSDFNNEAIEAFDVSDSTFALNGVVQNGVAVRSAWVLDTQGMIVHAQISENPGVIPDMDQVRKVLATLS